jgi:uncharacterized protein YndB with AHSA1/START domain
MMARESGSSLKFEQTFDASVDRVFDALTTEAAIAKWFGPSDEFQVTVHEWDCKVGDNYRVQFDTPNGEQHICIGEFREIVSGEKLSYTWAWENQPPMDTLVSFVLAADGDQTRLSMTHGGFPADEVRDHHEMGWAGSMDRLGRVLA